MLLTKCTQDLLAHCYAYMHIFYCPHMRNLLIMTDSSHFGDNARIVTDYLSPNAHIGGRLLVFFLPKKIMFANSHTVIPVCAMIFYDQSQFAH